MRPSVCTSLRCARNVNLRRTISEASSPTRTPDLQLRKEPLREQRLQLPLRTPRRFSAALQEACHRRPDVQKEEIFLSLGSKQRRASDIERRTFNRRRTSRWGEEGEVGDVLDVDGGAEERGRGETGGSERRSKVREFRLAKSSLAWRKQRDDGEGRTGRNDRPVDIKSASSVS